MYYVNGSNILKLLWIKFPNITSFLLEMLGNPVDNIFFSMDKIQ